MSHLLCQANFTDKFYRHALACGQLDITEYLDILVIRTEVIDSDSVNRGSNPRLPAKIINGLAIYG